jgi:hypothetical protein
VRPKTRTRTNDFIFFKIPDDQKYTIPAFGSVAKPGNAAQKIKTSHKKQHITMGILSKKSGKKRNFDFLHMI